MLPEACYRQRSIRLRPGDIFCAFTDGVTEALDPAGEEFGERRLETVLIEHAAATAADSCHETLSRLDRFTAGATQRDDITLIVGKVR